MMIRKYALLFLSLACYVYFTQWNLVYFLILAMLIVYSNHANKDIYKKYLALAVIASLVVGFILFKFSETSGMLLGYSVFAFCGISFIADQYKVGKKYDMIDILLYLFFFPKMLAGPIVRIDHFVNQLSSNWMSRRQLYQGTKLMIYGCFLKFMVADIFLNIDMSGVGFNLFVQTIIWGIRFYFDFYAYSLMAVGLAFMVGIQLPYNFDNPYSAISFRDIWHRWNITLTEWLGKYVYLPLGGSRCTPYKTCANVLLTFIISGLWHGLTMPFILWGFCHGILVCMERLLFNQQMDGMKKLAYRIWVVMITLFLWQLFRLSDICQVIDYISQLFSSAKVEKSIIIYGVIACASVYIVELPLVKRLMLGNERLQRNVICEVSILSIMLAIMILCPLHFTFNFFYLKF